MGTADRFGDIDFGPQAELDLGTLHLRWYDRRLCGIDNEPPVWIFVMGTNVWRNEHEWPLSRARGTRYAVLSAQQEWRQHARR